MTFDESVKNGLTILFKTKGVLKCSLVTLVLTTVFILVSITRNEWIESDSQQEGLWKSCSIVGNSTCCSTIKEVPGRQIIYDSIFIH